MIETTFCNSLFYFLSLFFLVLLIPYFAWPQLTCQNISLSHEKCIFIPIKCWINHFNKLRVQNPQICQVLLCFEGNIHEILRSVRCKYIEKYALKKTITQNNIYVVWQFAYVYRVVGISIFSGKNTICNSTVFFLKNYIKP